MAVLTAYLLGDVLVLVGGAVLAIYLFFLWSYQYWKREGISIVETPSFPFGNFQGMSSTKAMGAIMEELHKKKKNEPISGAYILHKPILVLRDIDVLKNILVKDFASFHDHGFDIDVKLEPLAGHLFLLNGKEWRNLRIKLTPTFTTGKMRMMFPTLFEVGRHLVEVLDKHSSSPEVEVKDILSRYTTDIIASVAFGLESNSLKNEDDEFRSVGQKLTEKNLRQILVGILAFTAPKLLSLLKIRMTPKYLADFFINTVDDVITYRQKNNVKRNDFMQLMLQLKTLGYIPDADSPKNNEVDASSESKFTTEQAAAQAFLFFFAGFETSSATMAFTLYELALNPDLQKQVQEEIDRVKAKNDGKITYDSLQQMDLLDRTVAETLRMYPVANVLTRQCNKDYQLPNSDLTIKKGYTVWISLAGIHHDPEHYPNPEKFNPDRFLPEEKEKRHPFAYLPFGDGPRSCIGNRFGLMQTKAGLSIILENFSVAPSKKTPIPMVFDPSADILQSKGGLYLKLTKRQK